MKEQSQMNLFSIQTVLGTNIPKQRQQQIMDQLAIIFLHYLELTRVADKNDKEISHVIKNNN